MEITNNINANKNSNKKLCTDMSLDITCIICLDKIDSILLKRTLQCEHMFHKHCLNEYIKNKINAFDIVCPICKLSNAKNYNLNIIQHSLPYFIISKEYNYDIYLKYYISFESFNIILIDYNITINNLIFQLNNLVFLIDKFTLDTLNDFYTKLLILLDKSIFKNNNSQETLSYLIAEKNTFNYEDYVILINFIHGIENTYKIFIKSELKKKLNIYKFNKYLLNDFNVYNEGEYETMISERINNVNETININKLHNMLIEYIK
jgi:hypothetical protein